VIRLAAEVEHWSLKTLSSGARYRWVYLFPLVAAQLGDGALAGAVTAARQVLEPSQQILPDDLTAALTEACAAWDAADPATTRARLAAALELARVHAYF
jgi:eukaryotic-like serine/threonine-protein kinase